MSLRLAGARELEEPRELWMMAQRAENRARQDERVDRGPFQKTRQLLESFVIGGAEGDVL